MALEDTAPLRSEIEEMLKNKKLVKVELKNKGVDDKVIKQIEDDLASYQNFEKPKKPEEV